MAYCWKCDWKIGRPYTGNVNCHKCKTDVGKLSGIHMGLGWEGFYDGRHIFMLTSIATCPGCGYENGYFASPCKATGEVVLVRMRFHENGNQEDTK